MSDSKVIVALLAGMAAGAAAGLLFAPQAGSETSDKVSESLTGLGESIKESAATQFDGLLDTFKTKFLEVIISKSGNQPEKEEAGDLEHA